MSDGTELIVPIIALGTIGAIMQGGKKRKRTVTTTRKGKTKTTTTTYSRGGLFGDLY